MGEKHVQFFITQVAEVIMLDRQLFRHEARDYRDIPNRVFDPRDLDCRCPALLKVRRQCLEKSRGELVARARTTPAGISRLKHHQLSLSVGRPSMQSAVLWFTPRQGRRSVSWLRHGRQYPEKREIEGDAANRRKAGPQARDMAAWSKSPPTGLSNRCIGFVSIR
jgi:hypothetical protein